MILKTFSVAQTKNLARLLYKEISKKRLKTKGALIIALSGDLGSGKTTFVQGFLRAAGIKKKITSPTFVLVKRFKNIYHIDCYRIRQARELIKLGLKEVFKNPQNIVLIEWAEKIKRILPKDAIWIKFKHGGKINERTIIFKQYFRNI